MGLWGIVSDTVIDMAWVEELPSGRWRGMYRAAGRKKSAGTYDSKRAALVKANAAEVNAKGQAPASEATWGEWERVWLANRRVAASTALQDERRIDRHVRPRWSSVKLRDITRAEVQVWVNELSDPDSESKLSASTVKKIFHLLSASLRAAINADMVSANPCTGVQLPKLAPSPEHWLSKDEVDAVRLVLADPYRFMFELLVGTGMRWGEATGLHWDHVNLDDKTIEVVWAHDRTGKFFKPPKSHSKRLIPIGDRLVGLLDGRLDETGYGEAPDLDYREMRKPAYGLVVATGSGTPPNAVSFAHGLEAAGQAAHVGEGNRRRRVGHIRPHDLRHTYASLLVQAGVPIQQVGKLLGHGSLQVTQRYAALGDSQWESVRMVLG